jgi:hypothetical protein
MLLKENKNAKIPLLKKTGVLQNKKQVIKILLVFTVVLIFYNIPKKYLGDTYPICLYRLILGKECLGCGTTRAIWSILHFNFKEAMEYNKLIVVICPLLIGCCISWIMKNEDTKTPNTD